MNAQTQYGTGTALSGQAIATQTPREPTVLESHREHLANVACELRVLVDGAEGIANRHFGPQPKAVPDKVEGGLHNSPVDPPMVHQLEVRTAGLATLVNELRVQLDRLRRL